MPPKSNNLVHETSTTTGTDGFTLVDVTSRQAFDEAFATGGADTFWYGIVNQDADEWEAGSGHIRSGEMKRDTIIDSSTGTRITFSAGTKDVTSGIPWEMQYDNIPVGTDGVYPDVSAQGTLGKPANRFAHVYVASEGGQVNWGDVNLSRATDGVGAFVGRFTIGSEAGDTTHIINGVTTTSQLEVHFSGDVGNVQGSAVHVHSNSEPNQSLAAGLRTLGTHAVPLKVTDNSKLFSVGGYGYDGTDYIHAAQIEMLVDGNAATDGMPGEIKLYTNAGGTTLTERAAIRADGTVEIVVGPLAPQTNDGAALGSTALRWSDIYLASEGGQANFGVDAILARATDGSISSSAHLEPSANDGVALGRGLRRWSDLYLATRGSLGGAINWGGISLAVATDSELTFADGVIRRPTIKDYGESVNNLATSGARSGGGGTTATETMDLELGNVIRCNLYLATDTTTLKVSNPPGSEGAEGDAGSFTLFLQRGGSQTVRYYATATGATRTAQAVRWTGGSAPTLSTGGTDLITGVSTNGGRAWTYSHVGTATS